MTTIDDPFTCDACHHKYNIIWVNSDGISMPIFCPFCGEELYFGPSAQTGPGKWKSDMGMIEQKEWALIMRAGPNSVITEEVTLYAMNPKKAAFHVKDALLFKRKKDAEDWARTHGLNWCFQPEKINDRRT